MNCDRIRKGDCVTGITNVKFCPVSQGFHYCKAFYIAVGMLLFLSKSSHAVNLDSLNVRGRPY